MLSVVMTLVFFLFNLFMRMILEENRVRASGPWGRQKNYECVAILAWILSLIREESSILVLIGNSSRTFN